MHIDMWGRGRYPAPRRREKCRTKDCQRQAETGEDYCPRHERRLEALREAARCWQA